MIINSINNTKIKELKKLRENKIMKEQQAFVIEGDHLVSEAKNMHLLKEIYKLENNDIDYGVPSNIISLNVMKNISLLPSISNVVGVCNFIPENKNLGNKIIILDDVQDPGNLGTIIRSAVAFNYDTIILSNNSVSKYNEKVIRATQGMIFKINIVQGNIYSFINELKSQNYLIYGTSVTGGVSLNSISKVSKFAIVLGNEGAGVSTEVLNMTDKNIYIDINKECESLNVAVAGSIIMYELK